MSYRATAKGKRGVRVKKAVFEVLSEHPDGLPANIIFDYIKLSSAQKFISNVGALSQLMRGMKGVVAEDGYAHTADGIKFKAKIYMLKYPEDFIEWLEDLPVGGAP